MFRDLLRRNRWQLSGTSEISEASDTWRQTTRMLGWLSLLALDLILVIVLFNAREPFGELTSIFTFLGFGYAIALVYWHFNKLVECVAQS